MSGMGIGKPAPQGKGPGEWPYSRVLAALVLFPTVPMLMLSVSALALFYLAPSRFGALLSRLPGESIIRSALVFAPATLFAIVILALLYVLEKPSLAGEESKAEDVVESVVRGKVPRRVFKLVAERVLSLCGLHPCVEQASLWGLCPCRPGC